MQNFAALLSSRDKELYLERSGMATRCRLAAQALAQGRGSVLLARNREEFNAARALTSLFIPELSLDDAAVGQAVWDSPCLAFPALSQWADRAAWSARLAALYGLAQGRPRCVIVGVQSLLLRYMPADFFDTRSLGLQKGNEYSPELVLDQAVEWGYERVSLVTRPGDMARRGDILDIFPSGYAKPVRLEFFGDTIEEMRLFDAESQRSLHALDELTLLPASPLSLDKPGLAAARKRCDQLFSEGRISENECYSFKKTLDGGGAGLLPGCVFETPSLLEDWLPPDSLWLLPGEADSAEALLNGRLALKEQLEAEDASLQQPANLALRKHSLPAPWRNFQCVFAEPPGHGG